MRSGLPGAEDLLLAGSSQWGSEHLCAEVDSPSLPRSIVFQMGSVKTNNAGKDGKTQNTYIDVMDSYLLFSLKANKATWTRTYGRGGRMWTCSVWQQARLEAFKSISVFAAVCREAAPVHRKASPQRQPFAMCLKPSQCASSTIINCSERTDIVQFNHSQNTLATY